MGDMTTGDIGAAIRAPTSERATTYYVVLLAAMLSFNLMDRQLLAVAVLVGVSYALSRMILKHHPPKETV